MKNVKKIDINSLANALEKGEMTSVELVKLCLERSEKSRELGAFITLFHEYAIASAQASDRRRAEGRSLGILDGIPFTIKDNLCVKGYPTTCGSRMLENFISPYTAEAVARLEAAGAIPMGKTNMDEFGMGSFTVNSYFGVTKNPCDVTRVAGGSSGGSAAAVAAGLVPFALGSDTGGSVRQPAAYCGVVGMKPTYGGVSRYGLVAYASSLDTVGVFSTNVRDSETVLSCICGRDDKDMTSIPLDIDVNKCQKEIKDMRIAVPFGVLDEVDPEIKEAVLEAVEYLRSVGVTVVDVRLPKRAVVHAAYYVIASCEASSNLGRYDGVRYGYRSQSAGSIDELFTQSRTCGFGEEVKKRILLGAYLLTGEQRSERYRRARGAAEAIKREMSEIFSDCDGLLMPVSSELAPSFSELGNRSAFCGYSADAFCGLANICGFPAISFPAKSSRGGLPVGLQLMARRGCENTLYSLCLNIEETGGFKYE